MTIGLAMGHFLLVVLWTQVSISNGFRDIPPQTSCAYRHNVNRHCVCAYHVTCTPYVKFKYIFQFLTPTLPIHYATFIRLWRRIRGVLSVTSHVKGQIERKLSKSKNLQNFDFLGALEIRGYEKLRFLLQKYHPCVNARRLSHFASISVGGVWPPGVSQKKSQKVTRGSHRNDVSPLTQGLRYRAACDTETKRCQTYLYYLQLDVWNTSLQSPLVYNTYDMYSVKVTCFLFLCYFMQSKQQKNRHGKLTKWCMVCIL